MEGGGAYGSGKATGQFDPLVFIKKPQVILRVVSWVFSIIVFGSISSKCYFENICIYNADASACSFGIAIGVLAFLGLMCFLIFDALFDNISSIQHRKYIVIADVIYSGVWTFLWFVCFCYLTDAWRKTTVTGTMNASSAEAAIAFAFFSIASFGGLTTLAVLQYRKGVSETFQPTGYEPDGMGGTTQPTPSPYTAYPGGDSGDPYQQSPFSSHEQKQAPGDFQPPTY